MHPWSAGRRHLTLSLEIASAPWIAPVVLLAVCGVAYGPLIAELGLYWDDWPSLWFLHFFGAQVFPQVFAIDRPLQGWLFVPTTALVGESLIAWQIFGILARWLSGMAFYWVLRSLWPERKVQALWIVILFLVYPGFTQQYIPMTYGHQFIIYSLFLASLALMVQSIRRPEAGIALAGAALLLSVLVMFALEYFFGLELLRPALIWIASAGLPLLPRQRLVFTLKRWAPYALANGFFLAWRITHPTPRGQIILFDRLTTDPLSALLELARTVLQDVLQAGALAWGRIFRIPDPFESKPVILLGYWLVVLSASGLLMAYLASLHRRQSDSSFAPLPEQGWARQATALGLYALLIGGWPIWATDLHLELAFPWDRFTLPLMPGAALLGVGLLALLIRRAGIKILLVSLIVGLAAGTHFQHAIGYRQEWQAQKDFFWQLAWRAPAIKSGTLLLLFSEDFNYVSDNSLSAPVNWIYAPHLASRQMPYLVYDLAGRLGGRLPALEPGISIEQEYRATHFSGTTSQVLVIDYSPPRCLKVIDPYRDRTLPNRPDLVTQAMPLSRVELVQPAPARPAHPPASIFGAEPEHSWCYYFQKAELARQAGDWQKVVDLARQALPLAPSGRENAHEVVPFIEGYAHSGNWQQALELSLRFGEQSDKMPFVLCDAWRRIASDTPPGTEKSAALQQINQRFQCGIP